ncbi:alpha/beta fold hydrolase [Paludibacterium paludis]|uniref:3-oxoadipate enol-lactonase n=1 Tax=Paludibacterium paludis TaxID=1225769 RepID=A0A918U7W3_9NEIS|nr:alpha/beta fold hydrolase [Paludibacterium paludis]GGY06591.1 3-oxoadipate enol-lactonase [Paludibacterium paludis]
MPTLRYQGHAIQIEETGHGAEPLILFNGITMSTASWALLQPMLEARYRLIRLDFLGQGQSDRPDLPRYDLAMQADIAAAALDHVGLDTAHVVGLSYGGMVAQHFARRHRARIRTLLLAATLAWADDASLAAMQSWTEANTAGGVDLRYTISIPWLFSSRFLAAHPGALDELKTIAARVDWPAVVRLMNGVREHDARTWLGDLALPVKVLIGTEDRLTPLYQANLIAGLIPGAVREELPGAGHVLHIEAAEAFARSIIAFCQP